MKKVLFFLTAFLAMGSLMAQTPSIVSTTPSNRNAVIEEYTGVNCTYCPDGHKHVNELMAANPGRVVAVNVHTGGYAAMYQTQWGEALMNQTGLQGFPAATVNRHVFTGNAMASSDRSAWGTWTNTVLGEASPANIGATAVIDPIARTISIDVEIYYTDDQTVTSNALNVVLLQDNVIGPQIGAANFYPEMMVGDLYRHNHMLRDMLTGQWGETITDISKNTLVQKHYDYTIPNIIGDVPIIDLADLQVAVYVCEGQKEVITGSYAEMSIAPAVYMAGMGCDQLSSCSLDYQPYVTISNTTDKNVASVTIEYDGTEMTFAKAIAAGDKDTIHMPLYTVTYDNSAVQNAATTKSAKLLGYTTDASENVAVEGASALSTTFAEFTIYTLEGPLYFEIGVDHYGGEDAASLTKQSNCNVVWHDEYTNLSGNQAKPARWYAYTLSPDEAGLYIFSVTDEYGDGVVGQYTSDGNVGFRLSTIAADGSKTVVINSDGNFGSEARYLLNVTNAGNGNYVGIEDATTVDFSVYPNPAHGQLYISAGEPVRMVEVIDVNGRTVMTLGANTTTVNTANLVNGVYVIRVTTDNGIGMQKFVKE